MREYLISSLYLVLMETTIEASTVNSSSDLPILENVCGDANNAHDSFKLVTGYHDSDMSFEKIIELQKLSEAGNLEAQHHLAFCYETGNGIEENQQETMKLYTASANAGYVHSIFKMGVQYEEGQGGVEQNDKKAIEYYVLACNAGSVDACYNLAECYRYGEMVEQDYQKALEYYKLGAKLGCIDSQQAIANWETIISSPNDNINICNPDEDNNDEDDDDDDDDDDNNLNQTDNSEKKTFNIDEIFKKFYNGFHFNILFDVLIRDETIILDIGFTDFKVKYHSKNGFTAPQLLYLFTRQYEHEMVVYDEIESGNIVIDEPDMEGKWRKFTDSENRKMFSGRMLDCFEYDSKTKTVHVGSSS
jgi:hypothetical protein